MLNSKSKYLVIALGLVFLNLAQAKTTSLLCETFTAGQSPLTTGAGSQFTGRDASYSTWSVSIETDDDGKVK